MELDQKNAEIARNYTFLERQEQREFDKLGKVKDSNARFSRYFWGKGRKFAMWENDNYQYYNAEQRVLRSSLAEFTQGPEIVSGDVSVTITFKEGGSSMEFHDKN